MVSLLKKCRNPHNNVPASTMQSAEHGAGSGQD